MSKLEVFSGLLTSAARVAGRRLSGRGLRPGWSFRFETFADALKRAEREVRKLPPSAQGEAWEMRAFPNPVLNRVRFEATTAGGVPAEWTIPKDDDGSSPVLLYLHGGWYSSGSPRNYRELLARATLAASVRALAIDYRLAPAHPFPAAIDDTVAAWRWLVGTGIAPTRIAVAGDSAGGGLAVALLTSLRDGGEPLPACAALLCPWVDLSASGGSLVDNARFDWSDPEAIAGRARLYLGDRDPTLPLASPVFANLRGLCPLLVQAGGAEMLLDQAARLAARAQEAGTSVTLQVAPEMIHDWQLFAALFPEGREAIVELARFLRRHLLPQSAD